MPLLPQVAPEKIDLDPARLQRAFDLLDEWTRGPDAPIPGAAVIVGRHGKTIAPRYFGRQGPERDAAPIRQDGLFLLASISKPVTYLAALMLVERGLLGLTERVVKYLPEFAAHHKDETLVQHLFTHTSGLPDMLENNLELRKKHAPLAMFIEGAIRDTVPLFPAGTNLSYQSMGTLVVAELVQQLSGLSIHDFLRREMFEPLGLKSTGLGSGGFPRERLVRVGPLDEASNTDYGWNSAYWQQLGAPWGGLYSTPEDFAVLCQLLLNGGKHSTVRLASPRTVEMMTTNRLHDLPDLPEPIRRAQPWGLGWRMNHPGLSDSFGDLLDQSVYGHWGATGTLCWIDPVRAGFCLLFTTMPKARATWRLTRLSNILAAAFV